MNRLAAHTGVWRWLTIGPAVAVFAVFTVLPIFNLLALSVHEVEWREGRSYWDAIGARHYAALPADGTYLAGVQNTLVFAVTAVTAQMVLGFILALFTSKVGRGRTFYRTVFIIPILIPGIVIGAIWKLMYNFDFGVINQGLALLGLPVQDWLGNQVLALPSIIVVDIWHWTPFCFLLLLAGVESLPSDIYEASKVDGATAWQELRYVTLPLMMPTIVVTLLFRIIVAFKVFDEVFLLTSGGPGTVTEVISFTVYRRFFAEGRQGYGAAMSLVTIFAIALAIIVVQGIARRRETHA